MEPESSDPLQTKPEMQHRRKQELLAGKKSMQERQETLQMTGQAPKLAAEQRGRIPKSARRFWEPLELSFSSLQL